MCGGLFVCRFGRRSSRFGGKIGLILEQIVGAHLENPAEFENSIDIRNALRALPFGNRLTGYPHPFGKILLRPSALSAQQCNFFGQCHCAHLLFVF